MRCRIWSLLRKIYAKYINNQKREKRDINKNKNQIAVVKYSMNRTYLCIVDHEDATIVPIVENM